MSYNISYIYRAIDKFTPIANKISKSVQNIKEKITQSKVAVQQFNKSLDSGASRANKLSAGLDKASASATRFRRSMAGVGNTHDNIPNLPSGGKAGKGSKALGLAGAGAALGLISAPIIGGVVESLKASAQIETMTRSFGVILKDAEKAKDLMENLKHLTLKTPFLLPALGDSTRMLLAAGVPLQDINTDITKLGDIAAGANMPLENMVAIFSKVKNQGRAMARDFYQLNKTPIRNIMQSMLKVDGKPITQIQLTKLISKGGISSSMYETALNVMTNKGGIYFHKMEAMLSSLGGRWMQFQHAEYLAKAAIGDTLVEMFGLKDLLKELSDRIMSATKSFQDFVKLHPNLARFILITVGLTVAMSGLLIIFGLIGGALAFVSAPLGLMIAGIIALTAAALTFKPVGDALNLIWQVMALGIDLVWQAIKFLGKELATLLPDFETFSNIGNKIADYFGGFSIEGLANNIQNSRAYLDEQGSKPINANKGSQSSINGSITVQAAKGTSITQSQWTQKNSDISLGVNMPGGAM